jgi:excisionase family DNA binding protein
MENGTGEILTAEQAAEMLHMRADSLARKLRRREIPGVKIGRRWLIRRATLEALLQPRPVEQETFNKGG